MGRDTENNSSYTTVVSLNIEVGCQKVSRDQCVGSQEESRRNESRR